MNPELEVIYHTWLEINPKPTYVATSSTLDNTPFYAQAVLFSCFRIAMASNFSLVFWFRS